MSEALYIGCVFGDWTALRPKTQKIGHYYSPGYVCRCKRGRERWVPTSNLTRGMTKRCKECSISKRIGASTRLRNAAAVRKSLAGSTRNGGELLEVNRQRFIFRCGQCGKQSQVISGSPTTAARRHSLICSGCASSARLRKNPLTMRELAERAGVTHQAISLRIKKRGYDAVAAEILGVHK